MTRSPRLLGAGSVMVDATTARRIRALAFATTRARATGLLAIGDQVFETARACGRIRAATLARIIARLDAIETGMQTKGVA